MRGGLVLTLALGWAIVAQAEVFKWTDEEGRTNYSDLRPEGQPDDTLRTPSADPDEAKAARKALEDRVIQFDSARRDRLEEEKKALELERKARWQAEECRRAQERLEQMLGPGRVARLNARGEREMLGPDERASAISMTRKRIAETCAPAPHE